MADMEDVIARARAIAAKLAGTILRLCQLKYDRCKYVNIIYVYSIDAQATFRLHRTVRN
jgi:hypothetical protein